MTPHPHGITLEPSDLSLLGAAFDEAWATVAADFAQSDASLAARARTELARIMLQLMELHQLGKEELRQTGVRIFRDETRCSPAWAGAASLQFQAAGARIPNS